MGTRLHRLRRRSQRAALRAAARLAPPRDAPLPALAGLERVLLVFVNFRIGNTVLATPGVAALAEACPRTTFDFVGGPSAAAVMKGHRLRRVLGVSRRDVAAPLRLARLVRALRGERYDAALHLGPATGSLGGLVVAFSGAPHRIGCRRGEGNVYFTAAVEPPRARHKVDQMREYLAQLGVRCERERELVLERAEETWAEGFLDGSLPAPRAALVGIFVGSRERKGKGWPLASAAAVAAGVRARGLRPLVWLGPDEAGRESEILAALGPAIYVREPDLRRVAALCARCAAVVAPDAGPMHLAIAVGTPTVAVFRRPNADKWGPRPPRGEAVVDPDGTDTERVLAALDRWLRPA
jgi:ADP-heptose:LPS heptosyltransferase